MRHAPSTHHAIHLVKRERLWLFRLDNAMRLQDLAGSCGKVQVRCFTRRDEVVSLRSVNVITVLDSSKRRTDLSTPVSATPARHGSLDEFEVHGHQVLDMDP
jgi:hypothetical protein